MFWEEIENRSQMLGTSRRNVLLEEVQKAVLTSLARKGCFDSVVFQGGTALRLFYGNPRFSEDIDLVLNEGVESYDLSQVMGSVAKFAHDTFPFVDSVDVDMQKNDPDMQRYVLRTRSDEPDRKLRLHIELASVPSHMNHARILDYPPVHPAVRVEDVAEIMADKVIALAFRSYLKGRDLWDLHFLGSERGVEVLWDLVRLKAGDYGETPEGLSAGLEGAVEKVRDGGRSVLEDELVRFLPGQVLRQYGPVLDSIPGFVIDLIRRHEPGKAGAVGP